MTARGPRRSRESLVALSDGHVGTRGSRKEGGPGSRPMVLAAGLFESRDSSEQLLEGPVWVGLDDLGGRSGSRWRLDLRRGLLLREIDGGAVRTLRFASLARPGVMVLRVEAPHGTVRAGAALRATGRFAQVRSEGAGDELTMTVTSDLGGGWASVARQRTATVAWGRAGSGGGVRRRSPAVYPRRRCPTGSR